MAEKNVLIVVGTLRKNGFNEQLAQRIEALLEGRANVSRLDYSAPPHEPGPRGPRASRGRGHARGGAPGRRRVVR